MAQVKVKIKDEMFLKYLKNTIQDFMYTNNTQMINSLGQIYDSRYMTMTNIMKLVELILIREENKDSILLQQDKKTYDLINKEHLYMKNYIYKYFRVTKMGMAVLIEPVQGLS